MNIGSTSKEANSPYFLSDQEGVQNTAAAWIAVTAKKKKRYQGPVGENVVFTIKGVWNDIGYWCRTSFSKILIKAIKK